MYPPQFFKCQQPLHWDWEQLIHFLSHLWPYTWGRKRDIYSTYKGLSTINIRGIIVFCIPLGILIPHTNLKRFGDRAFCTYAPRLWKKLPDNIKAAHSVQNLKALLKTFFLFEKEFIWLYGPWTSEHWLFFSSLTPFWTSVVKPFSPIGYQAIRQNPSFWIAAVPETLS